MSRVTLTQAQWDAERRAAKAAAAETIAANREDAVERLIDERGEYKAAELAGFRSVEEAKAAAADARQDDEEDAEEDGPYDGLTNAELSAELEERGLPHTGTKAELIARLTESDTE